MRHLLFKIPISELHCSSVACGKMLRSSVYKPTKGRDLPLTYEMANPAYQVGVRKSWNSWNTSNLWGGIRRSESSWEDMIIRKFVTGLFPSVLSSEVMSHFSFEDL